MYICEHEVDGDVVILDLKFNKIASIQGLSQPTEAANDHQSNTYVTTFGDFKLQKFSKDGRCVESVGGRGEAPGMFGLPNGIQVRHNQIFVCDCHRIQVFDTDLDLLKVIGKKGKGKGKFDGPCDLDFDSTGNMYVADSSNNQIQVL